MNTPDITPIEVQKPVRKVTYRWLASIVDEHFDTELPDASMKHLMAAAKGEFETKAEQVIAIIEATQQELVANPQPTPTERLMAQFYDEHDPRIDWHTERPAWMDESRPSWAKRENDRYTISDSDTVLPSEMRWKSDNLAVPLYGHCSEVITRGTGKITMATLDVWLTHKPNERAPRVRLGNYGTAKSKYDLLPSEAASLARALLLMVDLANEGQAPQPD